MSFIAGPYTATYNAVPVGQLAAGATIEHFVHKRLITGDNEGDTPQDAVHRGHEMFAEMTLMEYDQAGALDVFWPYNTTYGDNGQVGVLDVDLANAGGLSKPLVLTDVSGGGTAETNPATLTATHSILAEGFPVRLLFAPDLRDIPVRLRLYPNVSSVFVALT